MINKVEYGSGTYILSKQTDTGYEEVMREPLLCGILAVGYRPIVGHWYLSRIIEIEKTGKGYRFITDNNVYLLEKLDE